MSKKKHVIHVQYGFSTYVFEYDTASELGAMLAEYGCWMPNPFEPDFLEYDEYSEAYQAKREEMKMRGIRAKHPEKIGCRIR